MSVSAAPRNKKCRFRFTIVADAIWCTESQQWIFARELRMDYLPAGAEYLPPKDSQ